MSDAATGINIFNFPVMPVANQLLYALGQRIRALRLKKNWKQVDAAEYIGTSRSHFSDIERGKRDAGILTLQAVARALDTTLSRLLRGL